MAENIAVIVMLAAWAAGGVGMAVWCVRRSRADVEPEDT